MARVGSSGTISTLRPFRFRANVHRRTGKSFRNVSLRQSDGETLAVGTGITASIVGDSSGLAVNNASFGLIVSGDGNYALEASGEAGIRWSARCFLVDPSSLERNSTANARNRTITVNSMTGLRSMSLPQPARFTGNNLALSIDNYATIQGIFRLIRRMEICVPWRTSVSGGLTRNRFSRYSDQRNARDGRYASGQAGSRGSGNTQSVRHGHHRGICQPCKAAI
jgi:hypothetical protein